MILYCKLKILIYSKPLLINCPAIQKLGNV